MSDLSAASDTISPLVAVLWVFYPMTALVLIELLLRAFNDDDNDDDGGKGIRITQPITVPTGAWHAIHYIRSNFSTIHLFKCWSIHFSITNGIH